MLLATTVSPALAQPRDPGELALAETLFQDAKKQMDQGQFAEACPKLAESHRLDPASGTVLLLGLCYEGAKQWASAWAAFNTALALAIKDNRKDREQRARDKLALIEPRMARVSLEIPGSLSSLAGLQILRDGKELPRAAWTASFPLDPGPHKIEVKAPGKEPWSLEISLPYEGTTRTVTLPGELKSTAPPAASASAPTPPPPPPASVAPAVSTSAPVAGPPPPGGNHLAYSLGAVGLVGLGVGTFFGLRAISRSNDANDRCPETRCKDPGVVDLSKDASRDATLSNVGLVIGVLGLGAGVGLLLLGPDDKGPTRSSSRASVRVGATPLGAKGLGGGLLNLGGEF